MPLLIIVIIWRRSPYQPRSVECASEQHAAWQRIATTSTSSAASGFSAEAGMDE